MELDTYCLLEDILKLSGLLFACTQQIRCTSFVYFSGQQLAHQENSAPCIVDGAVI
jgi:hypothetical protein